MKLTNLQMDAFLSTASKISDRQLPIKLSYAIAKNVRLIEVEIKEYKAALAKVFEKYGEEKDGRFVIDMTNEEGVNEFRKVTEELSSMESEVNVYTLPISAVDGVDLSVSEMSALDIMFTEEG